MTALAESAAENLCSVLHAACQHAGLRSDRAVLVKYTNNAVFRLAHHAVVVRIGFGETGRIRAHRTVTVGRWLGEHGAPVAEPADHEQPVSIGDSSVTFWRAMPISSRDRDWTGADLAGLLSAFHRLTPDTSVLPPWDPFAVAERRLKAADPSLDRRDLEWLEGQWAQAHKEYDEIRQEMPLGVVHGDAHTGNLLADHDGRAVLCDLDNTGIGPEVWDLVPSAVGARRLGRANFNAQVVEAYGTDVTTLPCWPTLARIRELSLVTSVIPDLASRPDLAREHAHRLRTLRTGEASARWHRYR